MALSGSKSESEKSAVNWEVGPTEDVVQALLETLVDPVLPFTVSINDPHFIDAQNSVAKQMHAVVLLYNYYHRNQKPDLEFLDFVSFCKLALSQRPSLAVFMNIPNEVESTEANVDVNCHLSVTEKAVKDACDIAMTLDASDDVSVLKGWEIHKVAVLLVDSKKENCLLQFGAVTEGVWSLFECDVNRGAFAEGKVGMKRKISRDDSMFLQIAFDTVKGISGNDRSVLEVLESHSAYSLSRKKSAVRFYMMQCRKPFNTDQTVPLKFLVEILRGPIANKYNDSWMTTEFVEYYQMLPYVGFISSWLSRKNLCSTKSGEKESSQIKTDALPISEPRKHLPIKGPSQTTEANENVMKKRNKRSEVPVREEDKNVNLEIFDNDDFEYLKGSLSGNTKETQSMVELITKSHEDTNKKLNPKNVVYNRTRETSSPSHHSVSFKKKNAENQSGVAVKENPLQLVQFEASHDNNNIEIQNKRDSEDLKNALAVLCRKRQELCSQMYTNDDTLALYEDCIERLRDGGDVVLARQCIKSIISGNDEFFPKNETEPRTGSSGIFLPGLSSCQDLENVCATNNWRLPSYLVEPSDGKFLSNVVVASKSFELSLKGGLENGPREARESAAAQMIAKLRQHFFG
ncbi:hypothetical protein CASFOL_033633 [Castilleja foliolosa]|uniref:DRBM domain-containing protein n=1 Tax=Castilleja foliolosa TaxID=1961234 RepID=A0ABD3BY79_9LAMI